MLILSVKCLLYEKQRKQDRNSFQNILNSVILEILGIRPSIFLKGIEDVISNELPNVSNIPFFNLKLHPLQRKTILRDYLLDNSKF